jgi:branched-chain amino acid transport system substrate-binding protein
MKKRSILAVIFAVVLALGLLAGCGSSGGGATTAAPAGGGEETTAAPADGGGEETTKEASGGAPASTGSVVKIGYPNPSTGALAGHGEGAEWCISKMEDFVNNELGGIEMDGEMKRLEIILYDTQSDQNTCSEMADKLCVEDQVDIIIGMNTPETAVPVETKAEQHEVPCIGIQAPVDPCAYANDVSDWHTHAFWTVQSVYDEYQAMWTLAGYGPESHAKIGLAFANDSDGSSWGPLFYENATAAGYDVLPLDLYPSGSNDFSNVVKSFKDADIDILAGTNIPPDFSNLYTQMIAAGVSVDVVTMGKCCLLPGDVEALGDNVEGIMTEVWWQPSYPYKSDLTGLSGEEVDALYTADNGRGIPQPTGYSYAALELAITALKNAGTTDKAKIMEAIRNLDVTTIVGPIKYDKEMNGMQYAQTVMTGGQWQKQEDGTWGLEVVDATVFPELEGCITADYKEGNATNH